MARIIATLIFGGFSVMMLYIGITQLVQQRRNLAHAVPVDAVITRSEVSSSTSMDTDPRLNRSTSTTSHTPDVRFQYVVGGVRHEGERLHPTVIVRGYASRDAAAAALEAYPVNAKVRAWVDPSHPEQAFLVNDASAAPVVFIVIGLLLPPLVWWVGKFL